jgi:hypothetical protein
MGLNFLGSTNSTTSPNPNPSNFVIKDALQIREYAVLKVHYPGCTTYNGDKILVINGIVGEIKKRKALDPHFLEKDDSLVARFPYTPEGFADAQAFCRLKVNGEKSPV